MSGEVGEIGKGLTVKGPVGVVKRCLYFRQAIERS